MCRCCGIVFFFFIGEVGGGVCDLCTAAIHDVEGLLTSGVPEAVPGSTPFQFCVVCRWWFVGGVLVPLGQVLLRFFWRSILMGVLHWGLVPAAGDFGTSSQVALSGKFLTPFLFFLVVYPRRVE